MSSSDRERRVGFNEAVFREVNERIEDIAEQFNLGDQLLDLVCECGNPNCRDRISMTRTEYEAVRSDPMQFSVFPGHEYDDIEEIVDRHRGYDVVRKRAGEAAELAKASDPRK